MQQILTHLIQPLPAFPKNFVVLRESTNRKKLLLIKTRLTILINQTKKGSPINIGEPSIFYPSVTSWKHVATKQDRNDLGS